MKSTITYSIEGTDLILRSILRDVKSGTYLDVGANHPISISNTYLFYQLGWRGLAVDGHDKFAYLWSQFRAGDTFLTAIVSDAVKEVIFTMFPDDSISSIDEKTISRYKMRFEESLISSSSQSTTTIYDIWKSYLDAEVHLLSLDIEGEELNALRGANLDVFRPGVISVEIKNLSLYSPLSNGLVGYLTAAGYRLVAKTPLDCVFVDPEKDYLKWIPEQLVRLT
jgi:hypothetical protein